MFLRNVLDLKELWLQMWVRASGLSMKSRRRLGSALHSPDEAVALNSIPADRPYLVRGQVMSRCNEYM